jgi:hypothetical protein
VIKETHTGFYGTGRPIDYTPKDEKHNVANCIEFERTKGRWTIAQKMDQPNAGAKQQWFKK